MDVQESFGARLMRESMEEHQAKQARAERPTVAMFHLEDGETEYRLIIGHIIYDLTVNADQTTEWYVYDSNTQQMLAQSGEPS